MPSAKDVADYFLTKASFNDDDITNLKLQKLLYYAQGFHLALFDKELFNEKIEAWIHGPVCPDVYHEFKDYGANIISDYQISKDFDKIFSKEQLEFLDEIYEVFGQYSAWKLRNMTHEEPPWINHEKNSEEIPKEEMALYFKTRIASN